MEASKDLQYTFHRAFDWVDDPRRVVQELDNLGVHTILTSGQKKSALEGLGLLEELLGEKSNCIIMPGGGIRVENCSQFKNKGFEIIHLSGSGLLPTLDVLPKVSMNSPSFLKDAAVFVSDYKIIQTIVKAVK